MKHLPPEILTTARLNLLDLVKEMCTSCSEVIIPPGGEQEHDIYRCRAAHGKHCVVAINTRHCIKNRKGESRERESAKLESATRWGREQKEAEQRDAHSSQESKE